MIMKVTRELFLKLFSTNNATAAELSDQVGLIQLIKTTDKIEKSVGSGKNRSRSTHWTKLV